MAIRLLLTAVIGYFLGNLNGAFIMYKLLTHEDIRASGSGNAGLTNFMRKFGPSMAARVSSAVSLLLCVPIGAAR